MSGVRRLEKAAAQLKSKPVKKKIHNPHGMYKSESKGKHNPY